MSSLQPVAAGTERRVAADPSATEPRRACTPRELFSGLFADPESHVHLLKPALPFLTSMFARAHPVELSARQPAAFLDELLRWGRATLAPLPKERTAPSWPARVVRELGPVGSCDGVWLHGLVARGSVSAPIRQCLIEQLQIRLGVPDRDETHAQLYAALLASVGVPPGVIARWDFEEMVACSDVSYERGLLALLLAHFPDTFALETLGFNLWMATLGPAPILSQLRDTLKERRACLRYLESDQCPTLALRAAELALEAGVDPEARGRIARGFSAAHGAYLRWEQAMLGSNVPFTAWDSVLEMVRRKARFAADHHNDVRLGGKNVQELLADGGAAHDWLIERLAASPLIRPGAPDKSRFMTHTLSIDGPMFDAFTASEKEDLRDWIATLGTRDEARTTTPPVRPAGHYEPADDPERLADIARERYSELSAAELHQRLLGGERDPALRLAARSYVDDLLARLRRSFDEDPRLEAQTAPAYAEQDVARWLVEGRAGAGVSEPPGPLAEAQEPPLRISLGDWLGAFSDPRHAQFEECRCLFRMYATPGVAHSAARRRDQDESRARSGQLSTAAELVCEVLALHPRHFLPEVLGLTLGVAADPLSPDELASSSLAAVQAFLRRVKDGSPSAVEPMWKRIWGAWRCHELLTRGTTSQRQALAERFPDLTRAATRLRAAIFSTSG